MIVKLIGIDSSRPSHLIEVLQAMKHVAVYAGNMRHTYSAYNYGHYCIMYWKIIRKFVIIAFFHFLYRFNGSYKMQCSCLVLVLTAES